MIDKLLSNSNEHPNITDLIDTTSIVIIPCYNPDGYQDGNMTNSKGVDLYTDFTSRFETNGNGPTQAETVFFEDFVAEHPNFVLSATIFSGMHDIKIKLLTNKAILWFFILIKTMHNI
jgi:hypothetical protein